jgi:hypothetical protein
MTTSRFRYRARATTAGKALKGTYGSGSITTTDVNPVRILVKPTKKAAKALAAGRRLKLVIALTFKPRAGGPSLTARTSAKVTGRPRRKPHRGA